MAIRIAAGDHYGPVGEFLGSPLLVDSATPLGVQPVGQSGYTLAMSEEFTGTMTVLDAALGYVKFRNDGPKWSTWYPDWPRFNSQSPGGNHVNTDIASYYATKKVTLSGGALQLACDKEVTLAGLPYTAGMIQSLQFFTPTYGYFEARLRVVNQNVHGQWPAWWMSASPFDQWPPEIDMWEYFGNGDSYKNNTYMASVAGFVTDAIASPQTSYHTYGCKWTPNEVSFYADGVRTNIVTNLSQIPQSSQYLILNNGAALGANPVFASAPISVDYIRAWQNPTVTPPGQGGAL